MSTDQVNVANPVIAELEALVVFQAKQHAALHQQALQLQQALIHTRAVLGSTEKIAEERLSMLQRQAADLAAVHKFVGIGETLEELVKSAHDAAREPAEA